MIYIGKRILREPTKMHNANFECAAWYEDILVPAGEYPIHASELATCIINGKPRQCINWANYICYEGTIISDEFGARFCDVPIGNYDTKKNVGQKTSYSPHMYDYDLADAVITHPDEYILLPDFEVVTFNWEYEGTPHTSHAICKKEVA